MIRAAALLRTREVCAMPIPHDPHALELRVAKAMFAAVRGKSEKLEWGEVEPITEAYLTGARVAIAEIRAADEEARHADPSRQ